MNRETAEIVQVPTELTGEEALRRGLIPVPPEMVEILQAMTDEDRLAWAREQHVRTSLAGGAELVQPVAPLLERGLKRRNERNERKRARRQRRRK